MNRLPAQGWFASYGNIRTDSYVMLASLLGHPPTQDLVNILQSLQWDDAIPGKLHEALLALRQASHDTTLATMESEYNRLFMALGCGEMVPCASWYREGILQSPCLASLRSDLMRLGIIRQEGSHESEDHAAALLEIMALLSQNPDDTPHAVQADFYRRHMEPWMAKFFNDLRSIKGAGFFAAVGRFGGCFLESEREYLKYGMNTSLLIKEGGTKDEN